MFKEYIDECTTDNSTVNEVTARTAKGSIQEDIQEHYKGQFKEKQVIIDELVEAIQRIMDSGLPHPEWCNPRITKCDCGLHELTSALLKAEGRE